ncbi:MAG: hypothetical protein FWD68_18325 [Alphaproteobacteria bacterium]|nr:hypothetical protein [Alphaproteobacteria bacterium]
MEQAFRKGRSRELVECILVLQVEQPGALADLVIGAMDRDLSLRASVLTGATLNVMDDDARAVVAAETWRRARFFKPW